MIDGDKLCKAEAWIMFATTTGARTMLLEDILADWLMQKNLTSYEKAMWDARSTIKKIAESYSRNEEFEKV